MGHNSLAFIDDFYREKSRMQPIRQLSYHKPQSLAEELHSLIEWMPDDWKSERYGQGALINDFERQIADLLGKEAAIFMPSGTMTQQIALRIWADRQGTKRIAFHPLSHPEIHEQKAYEHLHGLQAQLIGSATSMITLADLDTLELPLAAILLELPQREIGGQLPTWDELTAISAWAKARNIRLHMDGARLWECQPFYGKSYAEIAALFDTVYVSVYKILGGIAGAVLTGPQDVIDEAKIWRRRHGGELVSMYPLILSARKGFEDYLPRVPAYAAKTQEICAALSQFPQLQLIPAVPCTNMTHIYFLEGEREALEAAAVAVRDEIGIALFRAVYKGHTLDRYMFELTIGEAGLELTTAEIVDAFSLLFQKAGL